MVFIINNILLYSHFLDYIQGTSIEFPDVHFYCVLKYPFTLVVCVASSENWPLSHHMKPER